MGGVTLLTLVEENNSAFEKLLDERERLEQQDIRRYRYFEDLYNNEYRWTINRQEDDKFHAYIMKAKITGGWLRYTKIKDRAFRKRKDAKSYCMNACIKAKEHQEQVLDRREQRKQERLASKPQFTKEELRIMDAKKKIKHYNTLIKRAETKIKSANTRIKTYKKRIRQQERRLK